MNNIRKFILFFALWLAVLPLCSQSVTITKEFTQVPFASALTMYKNEFGHHEKPLLDVIFPYAVIRMHLEGSEREVTIAKQRLTLYMGQHSASQDRNAEYSNLILFLVDARRPHIYVDCGDGCEKVLLSAGMQLQPDAVYDCTILFHLEENKDTIISPLNDVIEEITVNGVSFNMIKVGGGTFTMGATTEQGKYVDRDEKRTHQVTLSDYYIGETEVTQELWKVVMGFNPSKFSGKTNPVENVSWTESQMFIKKLNQLTGKQFRLPTEAEWEFAARGGNHNVGFRYAGGDNIDNVGWYFNRYSSSYNYRSNNNVENRPHPVKGKQPNELGLYDMSGNVWEWCQDWYDKYERSDLMNPIGPSTGESRVIRGGGWGSDANYCRVSNRGKQTPSVPDTDTGLRLAL